MSDGLDQVRAAAEARRYAANQVAAAAELAAQAAADLRAGRRRESELVADLHAAIRAATGTHQAVADAAGLSRGYVERLRTAG